MKKRVFLVILSLIMSMTVSSCQKNGTDISNNKPVTQKDTVLKPIQLSLGEGYQAEYNDESFDTIIKGSYPVVMPYNEDENNFPELTKALEANNKSEKDRLETFLEENRAYAQECYVTDREYFQNFESTVTPFVRRADTLVTSILYSRYEYIGGAHGDYYYYGKNYDTMSGKELVLSDVITDNEKLASAVSTQLQKYWSEITLNSSVDLSELLDDETFLSWTLDYNGITIYFMPYSIASYATGIQIVTISNEEYPGILKKEYQNIPSAYGVELAIDTPFYYDVTGDGTIDEIIFSAYESDFEGNPGELSIYVNGMMYDEEKWLYDANATFLHTKDGKNYLYIEVLQESDDRQTIFFDFSDGIKKIGEISGGLKRSYHEDGELLTTRDVLTNPEQFYFQNRTQHLSTVTGYKKYRIGNDGIPVSDDKLFTFPKENMFTFTLLKDFEVDVYDETKDTVTGKLTLKSKSQVLYYATDGEKYAFLKCSDGTICRVEAGFDREKSYYAVNGKNIEEIFDGILFAG